MLNGSVPDSLKTKLQRAEKERDDAKSADRQNRSYLYGTKSQKMKKSSGSDKPDDRDDDDRDSGEEKSDMGGKESMKPLESGQTTDDTADFWTHDHYEGERPNRQGQSNSTMEAREMILHESDASALPEGWTVIRDFYRSVYEKITKIVGHRIHFLICKDEKGTIKVVYQPKGKGGKRWVRDMKNVKAAIHEVKYGPVLNEAGKPIVDCVPGTSATAEMLAQLTTDHYLNNIPYYRLRNYYKDCGLKMALQSMINWIGRASEPLSKLIPLLVDRAITKEAVINCDEIWCKVRVKGKYKKRYTWCLVNRELGIVIYVYRKGARSREALKDILQDRLPMAMQTDGYNVYMYLDHISTLSGNR